MLDEEMRFASLREMRPWMFPLFWTAFLRQELHSTHNSFKSLASCDRIFIPICIHHLFSQYVPWFNLFHVSKRSKSYQTYVLMQDLTLYLTSSNSYSLIIDSIHLGYSSYNFQNTHNTSLHCTSQTPVSLQTPGSTPNLYPVRINRWLITGLLPEDRSDWWL